MHVLMSVDYVLYCQFNLASLCSSLRYVAVAYTHFTHAPLQRKY